MPSGPLLAEIVFSPRFESVSAVLTLGRYISGATVRLMMFQVPVEIGSRSNRVLRRCRQAFGRLLRQYWLREQANSDNRRGKWPLTHNHRAHRPRLTPKVQSLNLAGSYCLDSRIPWLITVDSTSVETRSLPFSGNAPVAIANTPLSEHLVLIQSRLSQPRYELPPRFERLSHEPVRNA